MVNGHEMFDTENKVTKYDESNHDDDAKNEDDGPNDNENDEELHLKRKPGARVTQDAVQCIAGSGRRTFCRVAIFFATLLQLFLPAARLNQTSFHVEPWMYGELRQFCTGEGG